MARRGVLSNSYIPLLSPITTSKVLSKLNTNSLYDLCLFWCKWSKLTQPPNADKAYEELLAMKRDKRSKRKLIDSILSNHWPKGLNLLQTSQIDIQNIVDKPASFNWVSSTARTSDDKKFIINLNSQIFLNTLIKNLSNLYLSHIYISKHPHYPLIMIRIQVFDYSIVPLIKSKNKKFIISRKPFFLAIPLNSPHIIHSELESQDLVSHLVIQSIENCLSTSVQQVRLHKDELESSVRTLETMHIFKGVSRFACSLGSWAPYADGTVDISPVGNPNEHFQVNQSKIYDNDTHAAAAGGDNDVDEDEQLSIRKKIANLRFKGTENPLRSERLYEDDRPIKRRKFASLNEDEEDDDDISIRENPYRSIAPVQKVQSDLVGSIDDKEVSIKIRFEGNDVFAGLHELCVNGVVDPVKMPGWLTGEEGNKFIRVQRSRDNDLI